MLEELLATQVQVLCFCSDCDKKETDVIGYMPDDIMDRWEAWQKKHAKLNPSCQGTLTVQKKS